MLALLAAVRVRCHSKRPYLSRLYQGPDVVANFGRVPKLVLEDRLIPNNPDTPKSDTSD